MIGEKGLKDWFSDIGDYYEIINILEKYNQSLDFHDVVPECYGTCHNRRTRLMSQIKAERKRFLYDILKVGDGVHGLFPSLV